MELRQPLNGLQLWGIKFYELHWTVNLLNLYYVEVSRCAAGRSLTVKSTGCGFYPHSRRLNVFFALVSRLSAAFSSATQHAMPPVFDRKWGTECLNTSFLSCCVRDTAWSWFIHFLYYVNLFNILSGHWLEL